MPGRRKATEKSAKKRCRIRFPSLRLILYIVERLKRRYPQDSIAVISGDALGSIITSARYAARYTRGPCRRKKLVAAATLFYEAIMSHPLTDGNKRLAVVLLRAFLRANRLKQPDFAYEAAVRVARGEWNVDDIVRWLLRAQRA